MCSNRLRREGTALVAYSLGNFVFGAASAETTATGILEADLSADGVAAARWRAGHIAGERPLTQRLPGACRSATRTRWRPAYSSERRQSTRLPVARLGDQGAPSTSAGATLSRSPRRPSRSLNGQGTGATKETGVVRLPERLQVRRPQVKVEVEPAERPAGSEAAGVARAHGDERAVTRAG
jgi:hypothetical protein